MQPNSCILGSMPAVCRPGSLSLYKAVARDCGCKCLGVKLQPLPGDKFARGRPLQARCQDLNEPVWPFANSSGDMPD